MQKPANPCGRLFVVVRENVQAAAANVTADTAVSAFIMPQAAHSQGNE
ncbi:hypothetical protein SAMCFNEI73_Ch0906 [Sinorhizobium americanum]|uniref:Uncharacterized protein n=1 Tax=Sinorhizobium americanum TaxID=194963 RepID=A0A1L3LJG8_9HYPH|nr:hypothetical protein SAMCCGM7_Ch0907 [Sinorhizobium americanum CCGM7]APG90228.1 hypothetical protein SAMCFNEI73_Ch0906 [Sinorhizobium americanum]